MPSASGQEKGKGHNPKGVVADDRNFNKDSNDRNNSDHESDEKSQVHLQPPRACSRCKQTPVNGGPKQFLPSSRGPPKIAGSK